ncbi:hypothetical protein HJC23_004577 [Cyclotella cryptica]|uniref:UMP/CMP kinase n=1 Tax=Cyclotella cryptica TaxID=29204 RepID=A0ABD3QA94_9STRA|eukprot:CCRYP_007332-RA/>CCRYP_007332-RA protein AED:0.02 eAED:-0.00 QI:0/-1/0/1/-1/1/1/0/417
MKALIKAQAAVSMAIMSSITTAGVARGFNFVNHFLPGISRSRGFQQVPLQLRGGASPNNRSFSSLLSLERASAAVTMDKTHDDREANEIEEAARTCLPLHKSLAITGSIPPPRSFGGISYLDTSSLDEKHSHRVIFVLGGPGAGKGTQSERIVDIYKCVHLSVGELLRSGADKEGYEHADLVKECLVKGKIVPVEVSLGLLRIAMDEKANEALADGEGYGSRIFLVDGFPRNFDNVNGWMKHMPSYTAVLGALVYNCPMEVLEKRILSRAETSGRSDDNLESARKRFNTFRKETQPVVRALERVEQLQSDEFGGSQLKVVNIDATGTVEDVWKATESAMNSFVTNDVLTANALLLKKEGHENMNAFKNVHVDINNGVNAVVTCDREIDGVVKKERRALQHGPTGWRCVGVERHRSKE